MGRALLVGAALALIVSAAWTTALRGPPRLFAQAAGGATGAGRPQLDLGAWLRVVGFFSIGFFLMLWSIALVAVRRVRALQIPADRFGPQACERCGYDIRSVRGDVCPECGEPLAPAIWPPTLGTREERRLSWIAFAWVIPFIGAMAGIVRVYQDGLIAGGAARVALALLAICWWFVAGRGIAAAQRRLRAKTKAQRGRERAGGRS